MGCKRLTIYFFYISVCRCQRCIQSQGFQVSSYGQSLCSLGPVSCNECGSNNSNCLQSLVGSTLSTFSLLLTLY